MNAEVDIVKTDLLRADLSFPYAFCTVVCLKDFI